MNYCNLGEVEGLLAVLGMEVERVPVWVATFYHDSYATVGNRLFSTKEKAENYKETMGRILKHHRGEVKITKRYIDETKSETEERCGRALS